MAHKDGSQNLVPISKRTKAEQREITKKGGEASGKSRRAKQSLKETVSQLMSMDASAILPEGLMEIMKANGCEQVTMQQAIIIGQILAAAKGNPKAAEFVTEHMPHDDAASTEANDALMKALGWDTAKVWKKRRAVKKTKAGSDK